jgi:membrane AbrB-like protein
MPPMFFAQIQHIRHVAETLLVATVGGAAAALAGVPAGWLSGAMLLVAVAAIAGRPMHVPNPLARAAFVIMGMSIGAVVTPQTLQGMAVWPLSIGLLTVAMLCINAATACYLYFIHRWDPLSSLFASSPGGLSQVMTLAAEVGADLRAIAIVQSIRVVILALGLPAALALIGLSGALPQAPAALSATNMLVEFIIMIVTSTLGALILQHLRLPGGLVFGAMLPSAVLHGSGILHVGLPYWGINALMVALGAIIGARFADANISVIARYFGAALGSFAVALSVASLFAAMAAWLLSLRPADVVVAFSPGAVDTMMLLALALGLDPVYVGAHHVARIILVSACLAVFVRFAGLRRAPPIHPKAKRQAIVED